MTGFPSFGRISQVEAPSLEARWLDVDVRAICVDTESQALRWGKETVGEF